MMQLKHPVHVEAQRPDRVGDEPSVGHRIRDCYWTVSMFILWQILPWRAFVVPQEPNSKGRHLVCIRWSHNTLCMCVCVCYCVCMCSHINVFLYIFYLPATDGRPAPDLCFKKVNEAGDMYGNCGKDLLGKYRSCKDRWRSKHLGSFTAISSRQIFTFTETMTS